MLFSNNNDNNYVGHLSITKKITVRGIEPKHRCFYADLSCRCMR